MYTATYSPDDNKLRFYSSTRLDSSTYQRVKAAGFRWAPKQDVFVAPMWTPEREDLLLELCGEIGDEDTSLVERAEHRAERFEEYQEKRREDAQAAHKTVKAISEHIPFGQPILVGHHSERRARKDAERIENNMRKAVKMWDTAQYWKQRAASAIRHAKYKERPDVRARRIKTIEADKRKQERIIAEAEKFIQLWQREGLTLDQAKAIANCDHISRCFPLSEFPREAPASQYEGPMSLWSALDGGVITAEQVKEIALRVHPRTIARAKRWIAHYDNRLEYERTMLADAGGTVADKTGPQKGGACRCWASPRGGWSYIQKVNKVSVTILDNWGNGGRNFTRTIPFDKLSAIMTAAQVQEARDAGLLVECQDGTGFFLRSAPSDDTREETPAERNDRLHRERLAAVGEKTAPADIEAMRGQLRQGVQVVSIPQLFPTPSNLAARMVELADIQPGNSVLEPSAGTGALLGAMGGRMFGHNPERGAIVAVEINPELAQWLAGDFPLTTVINDDFLRLNGDLGTFDRILMNPPFANAQDIEHILHAFTMLKPGGRLVAICANGPRQQEKLRPLVDQYEGEWEELPADTFKDSSTSVRTVLITVKR
jgi:phospholipid N-methyltransferase